MSKSYFIYLLCTYNTFKILYWNIQISWKCKCKCFHNTLIQIAEIFEFKLSCCSAIQYSSFHIRNIAVQIDISNPLFCYLYSCSTHLCCIILLQCNLYILKNRRECMLTFHMQDKSSVIVYNIIESECGKITRLEAISTKPQHSSMSALLCQ